MRFTAETSEMLEMGNFTSAIKYSSPDGLTSDSLSPTPSVCTDGRSYADVITNFLGWIDYQIFLAMGHHDNIIIISWALAHAKGAHRSTMGKKIW